MLVPQNCREHFTGANGLERAAARAGSSAAAGSRASAGPDDIQLDHDYHHRQRQYGRAAADDDLHACILTSHALCKTHDYAACALGGAGRESFIVLPYS